MSLIVHLWGLALLAVQAFDSKAVDSVALAATETQTHFLTRCLPCSRGHPP